MLCDEILADGAPGSGCDISCLLPAIKASQKFVLSAECAAVADALSSDYTGLVKAFPHCRLPFPTTWIEFAANERPEFSSTPIAYEALQKKPKRIGYLLTATRPDLSAWKTHLFWSVDGGCSCPASLAINFDMIEQLGEAADVRLAQAQVEVRKKAKNQINHPGWDKASDDIKKSMIAHTEPCMPDYGPPVADGLTISELETYASIMSRLSCADWAGEPAYLLAVIGLLNARNATETETVDHHKLNRARVKRGKLPLLEHKVLKIARRQQRRYVTDVHGSHTHARGHFVMGHWKVRKTGIFFWHPHKRGDFARGKIEKTYEVTE